MIYFIIFAVIFADQFSKYLILNNLDFGQIIPVFTGFNLVFVLNKGVSFSLFSNDNALTPWILTAITIVIVLFLFRWIKNEKTPLSRLALALVIGGAIGNIIDRIRFGGVVDFLDFYCYIYHWPAFNIADSAVCVGAFLLIYDKLKKGK